MTLIDKIIFTILSILVGSQLWMWNEGNKRNNSFNIAAAGAIIIITIGISANAIIYSLK